MLGRGTTRRWRWIFIHIFVRLEILVTLHLCPGDWGCMSIDNAAIRSVVLCFPLFLRFFLETTQRIEVLQDGRPLPRRNGLLGTKEIAWT